MFNNQLESQIKFLYKYNYFFSASCAYRSRNPGNKTTKYFTNVCIHS